MFQTMITLPAPNTVLQESSNWSNALFSEFAWAMYMIIGLALVGILIHFIVQLFQPKDDMEYLPKK